MISTNLEQYKSKRQQKLAQKQSQLKPSTYTTQTPFRDAERNFKSRLPPPDFSNVIDFYNLDQCNDELKNRIIKIELKVELGENGESENLFGDYKELKEEEKDFIKGGRRTAYLFKDLPGFIFIPNPFTPKAQKHIIKRCLRDFAKYPNKGNLDTHYLLPKEGLWNLHENIVNNDLNENHPQYFIPLKASVIGPTNDSFLNEEQGEQCSSFSQPRVTEQGKGEKQEAKEEEEKPEPPPSSGVPILTSSQLIKKIRWTTLGYQYHWPTKTYHLDKRLSFPKDIELLTTFVIKSIYGVKFITSEKKENEEKYFINDYDHKKWKPEAGVVNYYQLKDNLMAHVDKSEINMEAPLISFSFGHTCIFLIGGSTRDIAPIALYLRSGDISIMCGPCRANFHGVPRILEGTLPKYLEPYYDNDSEWNTYGDYMSSARINVNVRQVF